MAVEIQKKYLLGDFELDAGLHSLTHQGVPVPLSRKRFQVLLYLVEGRERLVTRKELLARFWDGHDVYEENLTKCVSEIRKALNDQKPYQFIETVPAVGYRYIGLCSEVALQGQSSVFAVERTRAVHVVVEEDDEPRPVLTAQSQPAQLTPRGTDTTRFVNQHIGKIALALALLVVIAIVIFFVYRRRAPQHPAQVIRTIQVTSGSGLDFYPSFSPDGSAIAYSSDRSGGFEIYVKQLALGGREIQVTSDGQQNMQAAWSPDGKLIAYYSRGRGGIWLVPALGGLPQQLTDFGSNPAWSSDGSQIAFQSAGVGDYLTAESAGAQPGSTIWVVATGAGTTRQITKPTNPLGGHGSPKWSPDGNRIVFAVFGGPKPNEIWSMRPDGSDSRLVSGRAGNPAYAPDGKWLYFAGDPPNTGYGLWRMPVSNDGLPGGQPTRVWNPGAFDIKQLSLSADGKRIVYGATTQTGGLWSISLASGSAAATGQPSLLTREISQRSSAPAFSPDGRKIAYSVLRPGADFSIWVANADGSEPYQLTSHGARPGWTPKGDEVVFYLNPREGGSGIWGIPTAGGKERLLIDLGTNVTFPRMSPSGKEVAFNSNQDGVINLWLSTVGGGAPKQLTFDRESAGYPSWSPDGKLLAIGLKRGDNGYLAIVPSAGGEVTQLTFEQGVSAANGWSPDGDKIVFAGCRNGYWNVYWISRTTKEQKQLTNFKKLNVLTRYPVWSPLGNQIVFEFTEITGNVWLLELG